MSFSFLNQEENHELALRIARDRKAEDERYKEQKAELVGKHGTLDPSGSGAYVWDLIIAAIEHQKALTRIAREALFSIIEAKDLQLTDGDVQSIAKFLSESFRGAWEQREREFITAGGAVGIQPRTDRGVKYAVDSAIHAEAYAEVRIRVAELRRTHKIERKRWWLKSGERLLWIVVGLVAGVVGTLLVRWMGGEG